MSSQHPKPNTGKKARIMILGTGGTIAGAAETGTQSGYTSGQVTIEGMIAAIPGIDQLADLSAEQLSNVGSQDMTFDIMIALARRINALFDADEADGVVVTHGTDTMEETAFFLGLTIKSKRPVVMTGSMRPSTAVSADGPLNLYNAVAVAADPQSADHGVLVVMNDRIHGAHSLTKTDTTAVETFLSPINGLMGTVAYGKIQYFRTPFRKHTHKSEFSVDDVTDLPRVDILYTCVDTPSDLVDASVDRGAQGIVIAGIGNGNMNEATAKRASRATEKGIIIVRSSRVPSGKISRNVEVDDDRLGFIASDELNPAKARIMLMLALLKERSLEEIQQLYFDY